MRLGKIKVSVSALLLASLFAGHFAFAQTQADEADDSAAGDPPLITATPAAPEAANGPSSPDATAESDVEVPAAPVANSRALEESSLSNPSGHDDYKRPLLFAPEDNGLQPDNPQIKWEMDPAGRRINLGGLKLQAGSIGAKIDLTSRTKAPSDIRLSAAGSPNVVIFSMYWPTILSKTGTVSIETLAGKVAWSHEVTEEMRAEWREKLSRYKSSYLRAHPNSQWGFTDLPAIALKPFRSGTPFRVCLSRTDSDIEKLKVCSVGYAFQPTTNGRSQILPVKVTDAANVFLHGKPVGARGLVNVPLGKEVALKIVFSSGESIEISSQPENLELLDVVESKDGREIVLTGRATQPLGKKKIVERPSLSFWAPTGIDQDTVWQVAIPKETPTIRMLGAFNLPFTFLFRYEKLPKESDRVFVSEASSTGSYSSTPLIEGFSPNLGRVTSTEESVEKLDEHKFDWTFAAPRKGERNRARVTLMGPANQPSKWVAHHTLYRGFPLEASARLAGVITVDGQILALGEVAASAWAESLGFKSNLLSRQRWGATARYFRSLTSVTSSTGVSIKNFSALNGDLKYNLVRGIWNRDQLFGLMGSLQTVSINDAKASLAGGGVYWARTMPRVFAQLFDKFPLLDYSKYVDVEFVYYPVAMSSGTIPGQSFNLNFHGKVFWTKRVYGEAGFGARRYGFSDPLANAVIGFTAVYGNIGMGIIF